MMRSECNSRAARYTETPTEFADKNISGTRFHELFMTPLPSDATASKVRKLIDNGKIHCKDIRVCKGKSGY